MLNAPSFGTFTAFDIVRFQNYNVADTQLTVIHPGALSSFAFNLITFATTPTTGFYLSVTDSDGVSPNILTIDIDSNPSNCSGDFTSLSGGAVVTWTPRFCS